MPKSITFFSRGKTPIYVNYVIAHNTVGRPQAADRRLHKKRLSHDDSLF